MAVVIDVKSTNGPFNRTIHISAGEMMEAAGSSDRYAIVRVHSITSETAKIKTAADIREFAKAAIKDIMLPPGVRIDGFSVDVKCLSWEPEIEVLRLNSL